MVKILTYTDLGVVGGGDEFDQMKPTVGMNEISKIRMYFLKYILTLTLALEIKICNLVPFILNSIT